jgi:transcriptional regulator with XRE-family HTH domain
METRPVKRDIFALRLCEAMARRGESCTSVGAAVGLTAGTISRYCNNLIAKPKAGVVRMIAEYLHAPESWLMGYDTPIDGINAKDVMIEARYYETLEIYLAETIRDVLELAFVDCPKKQEYLDKLAVLNPNGSTLTKLEPPAKYVIQEDEDDTVTVIVAPPADDAEEGAPAPVA